MVRRVLEVIALPVVLVVLWWFISAESQSFYFVPLSQIVSTFPPTWLQGQLLTDVAPSLIRLLVGYAIALLLGVLIGLVVGLWRSARAFAEPTLELFRGIPPPVLVPMLILFLGIGESMKVVVITVGCLWPILLNTVEGVRNTDPMLLDVARVYRFRRWTTLCTVVLRSASPAIVTGARQSLSIGIILMVISEMFSSTNGLGFLLIQFQRQFQIPQMWTAILLLGAIGVVLSFAFRLIERPILSWYFGLLRSERSGA